ncbi:hypothetical protein [Winogradskyella thalassocola]|uniref:Uncharacterized protein n=1 Tax=Winogradskyella thalassocola TaxID=262004 RepID=A0A1G8JGM4_9FLAO|nr:hypothetical protein [Winogradskyella thalassocola]SDI30231.1 hypothetical protein SAMN04489796_10975 [Winogradskyella thalassocola]
MKQYKFIAFAVCLTFFWSCEPSVVFSEPQPNGIAPLTLIPKHFQGIYWCENDSVSLRVHKNLIYKSKLFDVTFTQQEIEDTEDIKIENEQLVIKGLNESFPAIEKNGIIYSTINLKDTLFSNRISKHVLKQFKGHLILNNQIKDNHWEVKIMSLKPEGSLIISKVNYPENLAALETITTVKIIEKREREQILVSPTKTEFAQILDKKLIFIDNCQEFRPIILLKK